MHLKIFGKWQPFCVLLNRDHLVHALSQWEMVLHCNVSHWLSAYTEWSLDKPQSVSSYLSRKSLSCLCMSSDIAWCSLLQNIHNRPPSPIAHRWGWNMGCLLWVKNMGRVTELRLSWFCYQLIAKPGNKTATVPWPDPYDLYFIFTIATLFVILIAHHKTAVTPICQQWSYHSLVLSKPLVFC